MKRIQYKNKSYRFDLKNFETDSSYNITLHIYRGKERSPFIGCLIKEDTDPAEKVKHILNHYNFH